MILARRPERGRFGSWQGDLGVAQLLLVLQVFGLVVPELYHRMSDAVGVTLAWVVVMLCGPWLAWRLGASPVGRLARISSVLLLGVLVVPRLLAGWRDGLVWVAAAWALVVLLAALATRVDLAHWARWRRTIAAGACLFMLSQPVLAWMMAPSLAWPQVGPGAARPMVTTPEATLVLLLDELNAADASGLEAVLRRQGLVTSRTKLSPVSDATSRVVAATFIGHRMEGASACSPTAICNRGAALDFAMIHASRPDIDVVGVGQPYCAIQGLRSCQRTALPLSFHRWDRVSCALWRRVGWPGDRSHQACAQVYLQPWLEARADAMKALDAAPFWQQGGMLYAHLLLPHPPGTDVRQSLAQQYAANVQSAEQLVEKLVQRLVARARGDHRRVRVVIYSDHPFRPGAWCGSYPYSATGCTDRRHFADDAVPLIVGADRAVDLSGMRSNDQVFQVLARLP